MNFSEMPLEIWADMLEEQGEDTTELREWIASGLQVSESIYYSIDDYGNGRGYGSGYGSGYGYGNGYDYGYGYGSGYGNGYDYGYGYGRGYDDSAEDE